MDLTSILVNNLYSSGIRLLACRLWNSNPLSRPESEGGLEVVGIDEHGNTIHIVIDCKHAAYYRRFMEAGKIYIFKNIGCIPAAYYRPVSRDERLRINVGTQISEDAEFSRGINPYHFEFQTFAEAAKSVNRDTILTGHFSITLRRMEFQRFLKISCISYTTRNIKKNLDHLGGESSNSD